MQHKTASGVDRAPEMYRMPTDGGARLNLELGKQLTHRQRTQQFVDDEAHSSGIAAICAEIDDGPGKSRIGHIWHRHQELARKRIHHFLRPRIAPPVIRLYVDFVSSRH